MSTLNLQVQQRIIPFKPAQLQANTEWLIVYYDTHPITHKASGLDTESQILAQKGNASNTPSV